MDDPEEIRRIVIRISQKFGFSKESAEDFAQNILLKRLEGKGLSQNFKHGVIDEARKEFGRTDGRAIYYPVLSMDEHTELTPQTSQFNSVKDFLDFIDQMSPIHRCAIVLLLVWGLTRREIAFCLGCDEHFVGRILKKELS